MSVRLCTENCCVSPGCLRPARTVDLCALCLLAAPPHIRAVEALSMPPGDVPFLGSCPDYPPVWLGGKAA